MAKIDDVLAAGYLDDLRKMPLELVDDLKNILAERVRSPGYGRLPQLLAPAVDDELVAAVEATADAFRLASIGDMDDAEVRGMADKLDEVEQTLSEQRRQVHERIDALHTEVVRRYKEGEATVEGTLSQ
jgi:anti-sigma-K factor RsiG